MHKILGISPASIAGSLIIKGLIKGFEQIGAQTLVVDIRELNKQILNEFNPNLIVGYNYAHFCLPEAEEAVENSNAHIIHYFADEPLSKFAHSGNTELINKLSNSNNTVFCWDKECLNNLKNRSFYLPLAVDPDLYSVNSSTSEQYEITFVGRPLTSKRLVLLCDIIRYFPSKLHIYCFEKHFIQSIQKIKSLGLLSDNLLKVYEESYRGFLKTEQELAQVYFNSKININITEQGKTSLNYRVYEVLASGGFLLTDYMKDCSEYFIENEDLVWYKDNEDLIRNIEKYLYNEPERNKIVQKGKEKVFKYHTFKHRAQKIYEDIGISSAKASNVLPSKPFRTC